MKTNVLRGPLIKSAIVLIIFSLLVYLTAAQPGGNVWSALGTIIVGIFRTIQFAIGLLIGVAVCLAVLIGIFLGAVAIFDRSSASRMYEGLRHAFAEQMQGLLVAMAAEKKKEPEQPMIEEISTKLKSALDAAVISARRELATVREELGSRVKALSSRLSAVEESMESAVTGEEMEKVTADVEGVNETVAGLEQGLKQVQTELAGLTAQLAELTPDRLLGDLPGRLAALEEREIPEAVDLNPLQEQVAVLQAEIVEIRQSVESLVPATMEAPEVEAGKPAAAEDGKKGRAAANMEEKKGGGEHRLFSYFDDPADREKLADLVGSTLKKDMTYAQVIDFLVDRMGPELGQIITDHPSLAKDYIRQRRRSA